MLNPGELLQAGTQVATQTHSQQQTKDTPRSQRLTAAAGSRYVSAPLPEPLSAGGRRQQLPGSTSSASISDSTEARRWSLPAGPLTSLQHVPERVADAAEVAVGAAVQPVLQAGHVAQACIASLQQLILNGVAWVAKLLYRLQSMFYVKLRALLGKPSLRLKPQQESGGSLPGSRAPVGISAQPQTASVATWAPQPSGAVTIRGNSGRYTAQAQSNGQTCTSNSARTTTMLVSTQQPISPSPNGKASPWECWNVYQSVWALVCTCFPVLKGEVLRFVAVVVPGGRSVSLPRLAVVQPLGHVVTCS